MQNPRFPLRSGLLQAALGLAMIGAAQAAPSMSDGRRLYAPCVVCHQPNAWGSPDGTIPSLAGQQRQYLETQLALFRSGARVDTAMQVVAAHETFNNKQNIVALANYLAALDANPNPVEGSGAHLRVGQELYTHICAACHGVNGRGDPANRVPRIAGQNYPYLRRQIEVAAALHRDLAPPEMTSALRGMPALEKDALADYISRLGNSEPLLDSNSPPHSP
ncbi:MAG: c-type cytochrome [Steroidobacteraceae bacterium]